ncbi:MAG: hypothetical protein WCK35_21800, partial [Chloroflexota bacterium]
QSPWNFTFSCLTAFACTRLILPMHNSDVALTAAAPEITGAGQEDAHTVAGAVNPHRFPTGQDEEQK